MQRTNTILAILLAIPLAGCALSGKSPKVQAAPPKPAAAPPTTAPAPPPPLSIPQTRAQLPPPQPVPPDALATIEPPEEEPRPAPAPPPKAQPKRPTAQQPAAPKVEAPAAPVPEPGRQPVQEALSLVEKNRLRDEAYAARREITVLLSRVPARAQRQQHIKDRVDRIRTFQQQSLDFERNGDMQQARELAQRALVLARELR